MTLEFIDEEKDRNSNSVSKGNSDSDSRSSNTGNSTLLTIGLIGLGLLVGYFLFKEKNNVQVQASYQNDEQWDISRGLDGHINNLRVGRDAHVGSVNNMATYNDTSYRNNNIYPIGYNNCNSGSSISSIYPINGNNSSINNNINSVGADDIRRFIAMSIKEMMVNNFIDLNNNIILSDRERRRRFGMA